jgi:tetratricopeptide (TPR) repeat protein
MPDRQHHLKPMTALFFVSVALLLSAASKDDDRLHPDPRVPGIGILHNGVSIAQLDQEIKLHPRSVAAYLERGNAYLSDTENEKAMSDFNKAIALDPHCARGYIGMFYAYMDGKHNAEALAALKKAQEVGPPDLAIDALNLQANFHRHMEKYPQALEEYTRVINSNLLSKSRLCFTYQERGVVNDRMGKLQAAIADYTKAISIDPCAGRAYLFRANDYRDLGELKKSLADYDVVADNVERLPPNKRKPGFESSRKDLYRFRAIYYSRIKRPDLAKADEAKLYREQKVELDLTPFLGR